ncbi:MAG: acyl-CoA carboxylase subunit beta [Gammaproteobacteria bacterium]|nr:acyl-CoA carboxylase subunit beta [Gammaproteobacteria bacterium]
MKAIKTKIDPNSSGFKENYKGVSALAQTLKEHLAHSQNQGKLGSRERHQKAGKLLARERLRLLLDESSFFLELMPLSGCLPWEDWEGASLIGGIGTVGGRKCLVQANVPTIKGGSISPHTLLKAQRLDQIAEENQLPTIHLTESGGADLRKQADIFNYGGTLFRDLTRRSSRGLLSLTVVFGNCTAGGAYIPGMSDLVIMVKNQAKVFLAGPPLVKMATNEVVDDEALGGADMHARISGSADFLVQDETEGIELARELSTLLAQTQSSHPSFAQKAIVPPLYDPNEILGIVNQNYRYAFDSREIIARIVDGSEFLEFKPLYGPTLVTGWAYLGGYPVGILANNGVLFSESANKGAHFIQLSNTMNIPLLFLQNITGFMVGKKAEQEGIIKNGAKLINAVSNSTVPAITILMGASFGAGNYGMCGRAFNPRFLFAWPTSHLAIMGSRQASGVLNIIGQKPEREATSLHEEKKQKELDLLEGKMIEESDPYYATSRVWDDGIIDPRDTRKILEFCLSVFYQGEVKGTHEFGIFRM